MTKFGPRNRSKIVMLSKETEQYLKDWAEHIGLANGQSITVLIESLIRTAMDKKDFPKIHKSFKVVEQ